MQTVHLVYAYTLDRNRRSLAKERGVAYPSTEEVATTLEHWQTVWDKANKDERIIRRLSQLTTVVLPYPIEAYVFGGLMSPMSTPLFLPITQPNDKGIYSDEGFLDVFIHELTHRFASRVQGYPGLNDYYQSLRTKFPNESERTTDHLITYALLEQTIPELLGHEIWKETLNPPSEDYKRAIQLVQTLGAHTCIQEFRSFL